MKTMYRILSYMFCMAIGMYISSEFVCNKPIGIGNWVFAFLGFFVCTMLTILEED